MGANRHKDLDRYFDNLRKCREKVFDRFDVFETWEKDGKVLDVIIQFFRGKLNITSPFLLEKSSSKLSMT